MTEKNEHKSQYKLASALDIVENSLFGMPDHPMTAVKDTEWAQSLEDVDIFIAEREVLFQYLESAPTSQVKSWLVGIINTRQMLAAVTGIPF